MVRCKTDPPKWVSSQRPWSRHKFFQKFFSNIAYQSTTYPHTPAIPSIRTTQYPCALCYMHEIVQGEDHKILFKPLSRADALADMPEQPDLCRRPSPPRDCAVSIRRFPAMLLPSSGKARYPSRGLWPLIFTRTRIWSMSQVPRLQRPQPQAEPVPPHLQLSVARLTQKSSSSSRVSHPSSQLVKRTGRSLSQAPSATGRTSSRGPRLPGQTR